MYAPVHYHLIMKGVSRKGGRLTTRDRVLFSVQRLAEHSGNPVFKTDRFHRAVIHYRQYGCSPPKKAEWTLQDVLYFARNSYHTHMEMERCVE